MNLNEAVESALSGPAVYVLQSAAGDYLYKGSCRNLKARLKDHRAGRVSRTKNRRPLALVYKEACDSYPEALKREKWLKSGVGRDFLRATLKKEASDCR
ncbi:MAG: GIY-YIG nuclease family protein [Verrucomicrobia bacterium]|nr:GIY-YIG nuclease family protein [Verrucomicrobiota bacterium]